MWFHSKVIIIFSCVFNIWCVCEQQISDDVLILMLFRKECVRQNLEYKLNRKQENCGYANADQIFDFWTKICLSSPNLVILTPREITLYYEQFIIQRWNANLRKSFLYFAFGFCVFSFQKVRHLNEKRSSKVIS